MLRDPLTAPRQLHIIQTEVRLLFRNSLVGVAVTVIAATILSYLQRDVASLRANAGWWAYIVGVSALRLGLAHYYRRGYPADPSHRGWGTAFAWGAGLAGAGWGAAGVLFFSETHAPQMVFLIFVLGGMMLGGASILAPRREAYLAFLLPAGLVPAARMLLTGDETHTAMGLLAALFTGAVVSTTGRIHDTIDSSLRLQFENQDLVDELRVAKESAEALAQDLERRVEARTAELSQSNDRLREEMEQRKQMEEELLRARKLESIGVLAGGIAHDFNNFLTVVVGNTEIAQMRVDAGEPVDDTLEQIRHACRRAMFLSSQLLTFAKGGEPVRRPVSVEKLVLDAVQLARAGSSTSFDVEIARGLWPAEADSDQIAQVLHNILLNARQAMQDGGIIEVRAANVDDGGSKIGRAVRISIRDYGCGIPAEVLPRIFDPYFTTKTGGSGLGLATAYSIIVKHGGQIGVESRSGDGAVFTIDLPASQMAPAPETSLHPMMHSRAGRLLVMDDEESLRKLLFGVLTKLGYRVQTARDGAEAIALYEASTASGIPFDAVLLDLTVSGGMGGVEAAAKIRELDPGARLIVSSGYSDASVMSDHRAFGFDDVIPKPWSAAELSDVFRRVLVARPEINKASGERPEA